MISQELREFCERWFQKAQGYNKQRIHDCFDKFFTLFIVYNRLYAELTLSWARDKKIQLPKHGFPDEKAATKYVHNYLGTNHIWSNLQNDVCQQAINKIGELLKYQVFFIKLNRLSGEPRREEDLKLLENLKSGNRSVKVSALLDIIYSVRCNMFHGHKGFESVQTEILIPVAILLDKLAVLLYGKLSNDYEVGVLPLPPPTMPEQGLGAGE